MHHAEMHHALIEECLPEPPRGGEFIDKSRPILNTTAAAAAAFGIRLRVVRVQRALHV